MKFVLGEGDRISFWRNKWQDYKQLSLSFPKTYEVTREKDGLVKSFYKRDTYRIAVGRDQCYRKQTKKKLNYYKKET